MTMTKISMYHIDRRWAAAAATTTHVTMTMVWGRDISGDGKLKGGDPRVSVHTC